MASPEIIVKKPRKKKTNEKREEKKLEPDQVLKSEKGSEYLVERLLGVGGFGEVWKISMLKNPEKQFAMKTEPNQAERKSMLRLKCEVNLFEEIERASNQIDKSHFVKMYDKGKTADFKYYIMDLIWLSLREVKEKICGDSFTPHTKIKVARQTLKAIESLHEIGFLHRDIKPANYAVGLPPKDGLVYLLDFGIARPYKDKDGGVRKARKRVAYMGTLLYASMEALAQNEQARRDDLEVWMYMMIEFYDKDNLSWANVSKEEPQLHLDLRSELMQKSRELHAARKLKTPEKWCDIIDLLNAMEYEEVGNFTQINLLLSQICVDENIDENLPLDWVGKKPKSPERPKKEKKKKEKKKETKKKKTLENKDDEGGKDQKNRRKKGTDGGESGSEGSEIENSDDYDAYLKWKKLRRDRKKSPHIRGSNDHSDRDRKNLVRKKAPTEKKGDERKKDKDDGWNEEEDAKEPTKMIESKDNPDLKKEGNDFTPEKDGKKKGEKIPEVRNEKKKSGPMKKSGETPESNESNCDRVDKYKKKPIKKGGNWTPESNEDERDEKILQPMRAVRKNETNLTDKKIDRRKPTNRKTLDKDPIEKFPAVKNGTPEAKRAIEVVLFKKSDDKKK